MAKGRFYAVAKGRTPGIYSTWPECQNQVKGYSNPKFKKFATREEAEIFITINSTNNSPPFQNDISKDNGTNATISNPLQISNTPIENKENITDSYQLNKIESKSGKNYYAVKKGKIPGVYFTWPACEEQVKGFFYAQYRKFPTINEALKFITQSKWFYAVKNGRKPGIYIQWAQCESQIKDFPNPQFRKFASIDEALSFINYDDAKTFTFNVTTRRNENNTNSQSNINTKRKFEETDDGTPTKRLKETIDIENDINLKVNIEQEIVSKLHSDNKNRLLHLYTDGACTANGKKNAKAGIGVYWGSNHVLNTSKKLWGRATNNRAEIHAAGLALRQAKAYGYKNIMIHTDSKFMINSMTKWINKWETNDWTLINGEKVINKEDFLILKESMKDLDVEWKYCPGHRGIVGNEAADKLAKKAIKMP